MTNLRPFDASAADTVASWPTSVQESRWWCSDEAVTGETVASWASAPDVLSYVLVVDDDPVGYGELWLDEEEREVELARIILAPATRGRGYGRLLVTALTAEALTHHDAVGMRVVPDNERALRSYRAAGFVPVDQSLADEWNVGQPTPYVWLRYAG